MNDALWPPLPLDAWQPTYETLHMWTQVVGKVRLALTPMMNHWWNVPLYVTARGLTTGAMACGDRTVSVDFDFIDHRLVAACSSGETRQLGLEPMTVAAFHDRMMAMLAELGVTARIWPVPVEIPDPIPFREDTVHASYDPVAVERFFRVLLQSNRVLTEFRSRFAGKCSPVHFFWGSFDLAVTRFSGRRAAPRPDADTITRLSYNAELASIGFWPGGRGIDRPIYYAYGYPVPDGLADEPVQPAEAQWSSELGEFILDYDAVRTSTDPDAALLAFAESTYDAVARLQNWPVEELAQTP